MEITDSTWKSLYKISGVANISGRLDQITRTKILGVDYHHLSMPGADDLYVTEYGLPLLKTCCPRTFGQTRIGLRSIHKNSRVPAHYIKLQPKRLTVKAKTSL